MTEGPDDGRCSFFAVPGLISNILPDEKNPAGLFPEKFNVL
jgi:hypothetical protein